MISPPENWNPVCKEFLLTTLLVGEAFADKNKIDNLSKIRKGLYASKSILTDS